MSHGNAQLRSSGVHSTLPGMLKRILIIALGASLSAIGVLWLGAAASLDRERHYSAATAALPALSRGGSGLVSISAGGYTYRARVAGLGGVRGNLILLHGFPQSSAMWIPLIDAAGASGYQVVAFDQRGYSPGARPAATDAYRIDRLAADVLAVADAMGFDRFHLVGHDWGAAVGWYLVATQPERISTWTALSIPHITAFAAAMAADPEQRQRSAYVRLFRMPWLPERLLTFNRLNLLRSMYAGHPPQAVAEYLALFAEPGAMGAALNWYRAAGSCTLDHPGVSRPVLFIWGNEDPAVGRVAVEGQRKYLPDDHREIELDAGHWLMASRADLVVPAVLAFVEQH